MKGFKKPSKKELERKLQLMKRISAKTYREVDKNVIAVWRLADNSLIMKTKEVYVKTDSKKSQKHLYIYVRYVQDESRLVDAEEYYNLTEVRKEAARIRKLEASIRYADQENAIDAGRHEAEVIYKDLKTRYKGEPLKKAVRAAIKYWSSKRSVNEYGMYAYGIVKCLERKSR